MSTGSSITDIHVAHSEPAVSAMMRRINAMMDRGIKAIERRMTMEADARKALRETQRQANVKLGYEQEAKVVELPPKKSKAREQLIAKVLAEVCERKLNFAQAYRMYGVKRHQLVIHATKIGVELPKLGRGNCNGDTADKIRALIDLGMCNQDIADKIDTAKSYVRQVRKDYTGKAEPQQTPVRDKIKALLSQGLTVDEIQEQTGSHRTYIVETIRTSGWRTPKKDSTAAK